MKALTLLAGAITLTASQSSAQLSWTFNYVAPTHCNDRQCAVAVGPTGAVHVLYFHDNTTGGRGLLQYVRRTPVGAWSGPVDVAGSAFHGASLALGVGETPFAAYSNGGDETERVRHWSNGAFVDFGQPLTGGQFWKGGQGGSLIIDAQGRPSLAYFYGPGEDARFSEWIGASWHTVTVESSQRVGKGMCATRLSDGRPALAYFNQDTKRVHYAERTSAGTWSVSASFGNANALDLDSATGGNVMLLLTPDNVLGPISLHQRVAGTWSQDSPFPGSPYKYAQVHIDPAGTPHVAAVDLQGRVDYLRRSGGAWELHPVATGSQGGRYASIALSPSGAPLIAFTRIADDVLVLATGGSVLPTPLMTSITPDGGRVSGGTAITIAGQNFVAGATTVRIGGVLAVVTQATTTSVKCIAPAMAGLGAQAVEVATPTGSTMSLQTPSGVQPALFFSGYKAAAYGWPTPGGDPLGPGLEIDIANSTPHRLKLSVTNALPHRLGAMAGDFHHTGLPLNVFGTAGQSNGIWMNAYPSWFQTAPLLAMGVFLPSQVASPTVIRVLLEGPEGLPFTTDAQGDAAVSVDMWPYFVLPNRPTTLSFQAFIEDPSGRVWKRNEALAIVLNAAVTYRIGIAAHAGAQMMTLVASLHALDQFMAATDAPWTSSVASSVFQFIVGLINGAKLGIGVALALGTQLQAQTFPNPTFASSAGLEVTYYGP